MLTKSILPYDVSRGGQKIEKLDLSIFAYNQSNKLNHYIKSKTTDLIKQYNDMMLLWSWNNFVNEFTINFEPVIGKTYYLYEGATKFISILSPTEFKSCKYVGSTILCSDGYWINNNK